MDERKMGRKEGGNKSGWDVWGKRAGKYSNGITDLTSSLQEGAMYGREKEACSID